MNSLAKIVKSPNRKETVYTYILIAVFYTIVFLGIVIVLTQLSVGFHYNYKYAIAIDAGSTHSEVILYRWLANKLNGTGLIEQVHTCNVIPGISSYANDKVEQVSKDLVNCIMIMVNYLDSTKIEDVGIYLGATAGMRVLNMTDPSSVNAIFQKIKEDFQKLGLNHKRAEIISGQEEGLYAWIAANFLDNKLIPTNGTSQTNSTFGILDMGGASEQIAFYTNESKKDNLIHTCLFGKNYSIFTYSNLCYGSEQALNRYLDLVVSENHPKNNKLVKVACFPKGFVTASSKFSLNSICNKKRHNENNKLKLPELTLEGTGDFDQCRRIVDNMLDKFKCSSSYNSCFRNSPVKPIGMFYAISSFYYAVKLIFDLDKFKALSYHDFQSRVRELCQKSYDQQLQNKMTNVRFVHLNCFQLVYINFTLTNVYNFRPDLWHNIKFVDKIHGSALRWTLGLIMKETNSLPPEKMTYKRINVNLFVILSAILFILYLITNLTFCYYSAKMKTANKKAKTISVVTPSTSTSAANSTLNRGTQ